MKHPDWNGFVAAIVAEPEDDTARLVAADWLDEHGEHDRAAFIRVQVDLARLEASELGKSLEADELRKKERAILGPLSEAPRLWAAEECPELVRGVLTRGGAFQVQGAERLTWRRGFVESVRCPAAEWLRHGAHVRLRHPVRWVVLENCQALPREAWYAGLAALTGLATVVLLDGDAEAITWLSGWLRDTRVLSPAAG